MTVINEATAGTRSAISRMRPALLMRLQFIECMLHHYGTVNRSVIADYFGLSIPQVSSDISQYLELAPDNIEYDKSGKTYRRAPTFVRIWTS